MLHGAIENSRVFYSESGKRLGPWLARRGYDVYAADLRGRGGSLPHVSAVSRYGQTEAITQDIPAFMERIAAIRKGERQHWIAHSWGGVLMNSHLVRFPEHIPMVRSLTFFGTKRSIRAVNLQRIIQIGLFWNVIARIIVMRKGYLPASSVGFGLGSDDESRKSHLHCVTWAGRARWVDPDDGFDYGRAAGEVALPPALYLAAVGDACLGHPADVRRFMSESGHEGAPYLLLGKRHGNLHDYDHLSMVTHPDATSDHFPAVVRWIESH
ncbi:MAG: alpha/beta fold hydrolase [Spirochaetes bacterium]|nr:alpha/beta fold hydrolase [Spirochaetota bacterium]